MTEAKLKKDKEQLEKTLQNTDISKEERQALEDAVKNINVMLSSGKYSTVAKSKPAKTAKKKTPTKVKAGPAKKSTSPLDDCKEILAKYNQDKVVKKQRVAKRKRAGKPAALTVKETLENTADVVDNKIEKAKKSGKKVNLRSAINGIRDLLVPVFTHANKSERQEFLKDIQQMLRGFAKSYQLMYAYGGITDDDLFGWDYKKEVITGTDAAERAEKVKENFQAKGYTAEVKKIDDLDNVYHVYAEKRRTAEEGTVIEDGTEKSYPTGENIRIFHYRTENFDICPEATEMFDNIMSHVDSDRVKGFIVGVAEEIDGFLGWIKQEREKGSVTPEEIKDATGHLMKAMYMLYPVLTKMIGNDDPTRYYPRFAGEYMAELCNFPQKHADGGRIKSAINRDRAYESEEPHEQKYKRKKAPKHPKYKAKVMPSSNKVAKGKKMGRKNPVKKLFGGLVTVSSIDNLSAHSGDAWFPN